MIAAIESGEISWYTVQTYLVVTLGAAVWAGLATWLASRRKTRRLRLWIVFVLRFACACLAAPLVFFAHEFLLYGFVLTEAPALVVYMGMCLAIGAALGLAGGFALVPRVWFAVVLTALVGFVAYDNAGVMLMRPEGVMETLAWLGLAPETHAR